MEMGDVSWKGGTQGIARPTTIIRLKMQDAYSLCNVIELFCPKKVVKIKREGSFGFFKL
jgi:hypothetical protein